MRSSRRIAIVVQMVTTRGWRLVGGTMLILSGCASAGLRPHDMSAAEHERAALREDEKAEDAEARFNPSMSSPEGTGCSAFCFDTWSNPSSIHGEEAWQHRQLAARHRSASAALREAEAKECIGIPERDRDLSPFFHTADIKQVQHVDMQPAAAVYIISFAPVSGLETADMQRLLSCHLARNAVLGHEVEGMDYCPLVPRGVRARAEPGAPGIRVRLEVEGEASVEHVKERMGRLEASLRGDGT